MSNAIVSLKGVTKSFGPKVVLDGVDLEVGEGEIVGFVGPNGAGKSTCLRTCIGLLRRDGGTASVCGLDPNRDDLEIRRRTHYLTGETSIYHNLRGEQFLELARYGYAVDDNLVNLAPELFDLPLRERVRDYSAGMKQRLALRAALTSEVPLLILDEPDRALDPTARLEMRTVLHGLREKGRSILLSSHHLSEIEAVADRTVFLLNGRCVSHDRVQEARTEMRSLVRLRLTREVPLPDGAQLEEKAPDGSLLLRTTGDPVEWLGRIGSANILTAEVGPTRLEDLYRELTRATLTEDRGTR